MRVLQIIAGFGSGGAETLVKDLSIEMKQLGNDVYVAILDILEEEKSSIKKINELKTCGIPFQSFERIPGGYSIKTHFIIRKLLRNFNPDVVHFHSEIVGFYLLPFIITNNNVKWVFTIHNSIIKKTKINWFLRHPYIRKKIKRIYCSEEALNQQSKFFGKGDVISNCISLLSFKNIRSELNDKFNLSADEKLIIAVGRINEAKNQLLLIELASQLPNSYHFVLVGSHKETDLLLKLKEKIKELSLEKRFHLLGVRTDVYDLMHSADLFVSTSIYEGLPITVLEAMSCGIKILLSPIPEHIKVFNNQPGVYITQENSSNAFVNLIENMELLYNKNNLITERAVFIDSYSIKNSVKDHLNVYLSNIIK